MATKTLGTSGDYATFAAAIAGIATWDVLNVLDAGTYLESVYMTLAKTVQIVNLSGGTVTIQTPTGQHIGQTSGTAVVTWTGDFVHEIRKPGSGGTEYIWLLSNTSKLVLNGVTLKSDYTTGNTQAIYAQNGTAHDLHDCKLTGTYEALVTLADSAASSVIDGLAIDGLVEFVVRGNSAGSMFGAFDWQRIVGQCTRAPMHNAASGNRIDVTTAGYMGGCVLWGMTATGNCVYGSGTIAIDKCTFDGSKAYAFEAVSGVATGTSFRNVAFAGYSTCGVRVTGAALPGLVDYCARSNGCPALTNSAGSEGAHNVTADPLFVDYAGHDYRILATSPYKDAGTASALLTDPDGVTVPQGAGPDIGAFEWVPLTSPVTYESESLPEGTFFATDLQGNPLTGFAAFDLFPAMGDPLVSLAQIVLISLFSDRVAAYDDELPPGQTDRRGWHADTARDKMGSRLWLLECAAVDDDTLPKARHYAEEALGHMTRDGLATSVNIDMDIVEDEMNPAMARLEAEVEVRLDQKRGVILKFPDLWGL